MQGCVYLDKSGVKMIYSRGAAKSIPLSESTLGVDKRFTFYDQVHTTGIDVKQTQTASALLTLGKDMTFRDYAQVGVSHLASHHGTLCLAQSLTD